MKIQLIKIISIISVTLVILFGAAIFAINSVANTLRDSCTNCQRIGDVDQSGSVDLEDAFYILYHVFFPERFPLPLCDTHTENETPETKEEPEAIQKSTLSEERYGFFSYWLYTPKNATVDMPMIVYLHGGSGKGEDLGLIMEADGFPKYLKEGLLGEIPAYVIIPQLPSSEKGWTGVKNELISLINYISSSFSINTERISLTGHSMGGTGAWGIALAAPETFCAVAPLSGSVKLNEENAEKLSSIPVWAIVGDEDTIVSPESSIEFIQYIKDTNPYAKITILEGNDHFEVPTFYKDYTAEIIRFLLQQE